jgi:orotidine-5'-phosphate decarboxylase
MTRFRQPAQDAPPVVVALDFPDLDSALGLVSKLGPQRCWYKVGCQLFARYGRQAVDKLVAQGCDVFVDLKVNGYPKTDYALGRSIATWRVRLVDIHLALGEESIREFLEGLRTVDPAPKVLGVTVLTSHSDASQFGVSESRRDVVMRLASRATKIGLDGVVAAASDVRDIKASVGEDFLVVTPGIRPSGSPTHEQRQVATPAEAVRAGANYLVVGRPITQSPHPRKALEDILEEVKSASSGLGGCERIGMKSVATTHAMPL